MTDAPLTPRTVMFVAQRPSDYIEMRRGALALKQFGWPTQILYVHGGPFGDEEKDVAENIEVLKKNGEITDYYFLFYGDYDFSGKWQKETPKKRKPLQFPMKRYVVLAINTVYENAIRPLVHVAIRILNRVHHIVFYRESFADITKTLQRMKPDAIVLPEDIVGPVTPLLIKAGHAAGIPSVILPYTIANQQEAFRSLADNPAYQLRKLENWIMGKLFPVWVMRQQGKALVRLPASYIVGQVMTGTVPPDPWMMNSGYANVIAVENEAMHDYYADSGIPKSKMTVVGAIYDDHLAHYKLNKKSELRTLRAELGIESAKPLLTIGGCPDQTQSCPAGFEFADMAAFCEALGRAAAALQDDFEVVVRPHPSYHEMGSVLAATGLRVTMIDTARMVALSDVYVAFASATIRWAIACGVPTINYDVFHYDYDDFRGVDGVVNVDSFPDLERALADMRPGTAHRAELQAGIERSAARWGRLDGRSVQRIAALIDAQCRLEPVPRTCY